MAKKPAHDEETVEERAEYERQQKADEEKEARRKYAESKAVVLRAVSRTGWFWPSEDN